MAAVPVITIDGPSGSGKGTVAILVAQRLGWHFLDSGALYRLVGLAAERAGHDTAAALDGPAIARIAAGMQVEFTDGRVLLSGEDVSLAIRSERAGNAASRVAAIPAVRAALLDWQRHAARWPGLVADGRDMGTVVFPEAPVKFFLTASAEERARRRYNQLKEKGIEVNIDSLALEIRERDERDQARSVAPLKAPEGALVVDSTGLGIEAVLAIALARISEVLPDALAGNGVAA